MGRRIAAALRLPLAVVLSVVAGLSVLGLPGPAAGATGGATEGATAAPRRVVSLSLCADQFVLALAAREQIAGLSRLAADPNLTPSAAQASGLHRHGGTAEEILMLKPDLVVDGGFTRGRTVAMLEHLGIPVLRLRGAVTLAGILPQIDAVAAAVGQPERGRALRRSLEARLAGAGTAPALGTAMLYRPGGEVPGSRGIVNDVMAAAGLTNIGGRLSTRPNGRVMVEQLALDPPDVLVVDSRRPDRPGVGQSVLDHPALRPLAGRMREVSFPLKYWLCAGPGSIDGVALLREAARGGGGAS
ncbi:ABC transporter substrate-binding protein [Rhodocista pekingensis]|uniref:ABC transporter substrate-binding protein n=1 Tax=Rhodocista pekingensis TaxID=201185 RepID=A0ABW2L0V0_9PROT